MTEILAQHVWGPGFDFYHAQLFTGWAGGGLLTVSQGWPQTVILQFSEFQVARIIGMATVPGSKWSFIWQYIVNLVAHKWTYNISIDNSL
jgi:hypothetical protein